MKKEQQQQSAMQQQHPMVSVPEALRIVLLETARSWMRIRGKNINHAHQQDDDDDATTLLSLQELVVGQRLAENVYMPEFGVGYPSYRASVMDGYCIQTSDYIKYYGNSNINRNNQQEHQFLVVDKVHAGDDHDERKKSHQCKENEAAMTTAATTTINNRPEEDRLPLPTACYITTGAVVPDWYDCVIPIEEVQLQQQQSNDTRTIITIASPSMTTVSPGQWIRGAGCDIAPGSLVLSKHHVLNAISIGLLHQAFGSDTSRSRSRSAVVPIRRRIRVGVLSTGNEIYDVSDATASSLSGSTGKIPDVNRPILLSLLQQESWKDCCIGVDLGMVRDDDVELVTNRLRAATETCDVVITTGGISMGETDIVEHVLVDRLGGRLHFGRLHMKPGKPTTFVTFDEHNHKQQKKNKKLAMVFAMPGNPVSATVCTHLLVQPAVKLLYYGPKDDDDSAAAANTITHGDDAMGHAWLDRVVENAAVHVEVQARLAQDLQLDVERPEYHRVRLDYHKTHRAATEMTTTLSTTTTMDTDITAISTGVQRSSRLLSLLHADGLAVLPQATVRNDVAAAGTICTVLLINNPYGIPAATVRTSRHLNSQTLLLQSTTAATASSTAAPSKPPLRIGIIQIKPNPSEGESSSTRQEAATGDDNQDSVISDMVQTALSGSKSGAAVVSSFHIYMGREPNGVYEFIQKVQKNNVNDLMVIIGPTTDTSSSSASSSSSFLYHTATANALRQQLSKTADALAMQAKRGAAAQDPKAALYETVVGYINEDGGSSHRSRNDGVWVIFLSALGLEGGLCNVQGPMKHALQIARGGDDHHPHPREQHQ